MTIDVAEAELQPELITQSSLVDIRAHLQHPGPRRRGVDIDLDFDIDRTDDKHGPIAARGIVFAVLIAAPLWGVIGLAIYLLV